MIWNCYITYQKKTAPIEYGCMKRQLDLPDTERCDMAAVVIIASKRFKVSEESVLAIPAPRKEVRNPVKFRNQDGLRPRQNP